MTRTAFLKATALAALVVASQSDALAQRGRWERLGEANVDGGSDHDTIRVGRDEGIYSAIRFRVERGPIEFDRIVIEYGDGGRQELRVANRLRPGEQSRVIDLPGNRRVIKKVEIWYERARPGSAKPRLVLFGRR